MRAIREQFYFEITESHGHSETVKVPFAASPANAAAKLDLPFLRHGCQCGVGRNGSQWNSRKRAAKAPRNARRMRRYSPNTVRMAAQ
jgi:hypothetical protein